MIFEFPARFPFRRISWRVNSIKIKTMASSSFAEKVASTASKEVEIKPIEDGIDALDFSGKTMIPNAQ